MAEQPLSSDHEAASVLSVPAQRAPPDMPRARRRPWSGITLVRLAVLITAGVIVVLFATQWDRWVGLAVRQVTDDAYVRGDITPLSAQVEGYVGRVPVDDFQRVKQGELLVQIEDDDYRARVAQAEATCTRPKPRRAVLKPKPEAGAGNCNAPWRTSTTKSPFCTLASPLSIRARRC